MSFVIRWNRSVEMVTLQILTGGQFCTGSYGTFRFLIFIARKKTFESDNDGNEMSLICDYLSNKITQPSFAELLLELWDKM